MTIQQLKYIVEVSKCSTISKAAQSLFLTQPTLSKAIKDLEDELQITILERGSSRTRFTAEGTELLCYAKQLLEQAESIENRFLNNHGEKKHFAISTQHYAFTVKSFIELLNHDLKSDFEFYFRECKTHEIIDDVFSQRSDVGVMFMSDATIRYLKRVLASKDIEFHELKSFSPHAFLRKGHPLSKCEKITLNQLEAFICLSYEQDTSSLNFAEETISVSKPKKIVYLRDRATMNNLIANTDAYNIGTGCLMDGIIDDNIISIPIEGFSEKMVVGWIKLKNTNLTPELHAYVKLMEESIHTSYTGKKRFC